MADKRHRKKKKKGLAIPIIVFIIPLILLICVGAFAASGYPQKVMKFRAQAQTLVNESSKDTFVPSQTGGIYDSKGKIISDIASDKIATYISYDSIPEEFTKAMVSTEDSNFYKHHGVDYGAILRAAIAYVTKNGKITQGGSTITMQLAKNIFLNSSQTLDRKIEEAFIAHDLEKKYSKDEIMEFYLNNIYFNNGLYGVKAACKGYFSCDLDDLDLSQIAFLCAIPNSPTYYDPVTNISHTLERRNLILKNMLKKKFISQDEYMKAATEDITLKRHNMTSDSAGKHNYVDTFAYHCAALALMEKEGFEFKYDFSSDTARKEYQKKYDEAYQACQTKIYSGKYKLYTSIDMDIQNKLQYEIDMELATFLGMDSQGDYKLQGAGVCIDNSTGFVTAAVGGRTNPNFTGYTFNRAYQSYRQPGSSIKPLNVYTPIFEEGKYTPSSYIRDEEIEDGPKNATNRYYGNVSIRRAVEMSLNTVAWKLYDELGPATGLSYLKKMHFSQIVDADDTLATSIGGFTYGVTPVEMTSGFATLENHGIYREPTCITRIVDYLGNTVYQADEEETRVYQADAADTMTDVLKGVINNYNGTGYGLALRNMPSAGKTGTTDDSKDGWFIGYTSYYTTGVWVGCDQPEEIEGLHGSTYPGKIWHNFMNEIHEDLDRKELDTNSAGTDYDEDYEE